MKGKNLILMALIALAAGVLMLIFRDSLANGVIITWTGVLFIVAGLLNVTIFLGSRDREGRARMGAFGTAFGWIASAAAVIMGLAMVIFHSAFVALFGFMFGIMLLFCALFQIFLLVFGTKPVRLPGAYYIVPVLLIVGAVYVFSLKSGLDERSIMTVSSIGLMLFGAASLVECAHIDNLRRKAMRPRVPEANPSHDSEPEAEPKVEEEKGPKDAEKM